MTKTEGKKGYHMDIIDRIYKDIPSFTDIFTEDTFYVFCFCFVITTILIAVILSRYIKLKPID